MDQNKDEGRIRLFVGGLSAEVSSVDLKERFAPLGTVLSVTITPAKYGSGPHRGFAYVDFLPTSEASLRKLFSAYNGCKWRGGVLRIEVAKQHYVDKLHKEWAADAEALAAKEAEALRKKSDVPSMPAPNQAKPWPLLLLEQPEKKDKWKRKKDFEQGAETDGIKIFFPRLKKVKTVPSKGLGKHKRSFQRVESLPLQQLSTCDCAESLHSGSCDCSIAQPVAGAAHDHGVASGECDAVSLQIAKERQSQLELLSRLFPSESPRKPKLAMDLTTSSPRNGAEIKKGAMTELTTDDSGRRASALAISYRHLENDDDSKELLVSVSKWDSRKDAAEVVEKKVREPEKDVRLPQTEEENAKIQADEPEMWVSFMETMSLPVKTEENVSEFDLDELSLMLSEGEEESEEEETLEPSPEARKKKAKRHKKKGKKSKLVTQTEPGNVQEAVRFQGDESNAQVKTVRTSSGEDVEMSLSDSTELLTSTGNEMNRTDEDTPVQADGSKNDEEVSLASRMITEQGCLDEPLANHTGTEIAKKVMESADDESTENPSHLDYRDEYFAGTTSSDESLDFKADEGEMWVSGIDQVERGPTYLGPVDVSSRSKGSGSKKSRSLPKGDEEAEEELFGQDSERALAPADKLGKELPLSTMSKLPREILSSSDKEEGALASDKCGGGVESEGDEPEVWVSGLDRTEDGESSDLDSDDEKEHPELIVSGLESTSAMLHDTKGNTKSVLPILPAPICGAEEGPTKAAAVSSTPMKNGGEVSAEKTEEVKPKDENSITQAPLLSKIECQVLNASQSNEAPAPKRNELTRATWKSLVGETGRVVFSLQQVLGEYSTHLNPASGESIAVEDSHVEEKSGGSEAAEKGDGTSGPSTNDPGEKKHGIINTGKSSLKFRKDFREVDVTPSVSLFSDSNVCPFMKSPDAEQEWLATKLELRTDYRSKHKQAVKKSRKLRGR